MRYSDKQYAAALLDLYRERTPRLVSLFANKILADKKEKRLPKIIASFEELLAKETESEKAGIIVSAAECRADLLGESAGKMKIKIQPSLLAGVRIIIGDDQLDNSLAHRWSKIKSALVNLN
jgi:F0F1-type ATP synthase delta subunit